MTRRYREEFDEEEWEEMVDRFADPGGESALHPESPTNPRNLPCPTCKRPNTLTQKDQFKGYQCDRCADEVEGRWYGF